ncbi:hypothetical protein RDI58_010903 [Solanum bulbocastanum]|uniref:Uncharacterized protein n=1 Tax=Solanum bulbocastanum TaxID=147425 RepID=A0AAN8TUL9_SOLBU
MNLNDKEEVVHMLGFTLGGLPFRYLGVPLSTKKLTIPQCVTLLEMITKRVRCWSARMLSHAGRLQLIKSVIFGMQSYWAQIFVLPTKIVKLVEAVCRSFLWTGTGEFSRKAREGVSTRFSWTECNKPSVMEKSCNIKAIVGHNFKGGHLVDQMHYCYVKNKNIEQMITP